MEESVPGYLITISHSSRLWSCQGTPSSSEQLLPSFTAGHRQAGSDIRNGSRGIMLSGLFHGRLFCRRTEYEIFGLYEHNFGLAAPLHGVSLPKWK